MKPLKIQIKIPDGDWRYVTGIKGNDFLTSIYPTNALSDEFLQACIDANPLYQFRAV